MPTLNLFCLRQGSLSLHLTLLLYNGPLKNDKCEGHAKNGQSTKLNY